MNSLDDLVLVRRNLQLFDNVSNLQKPAIDYFHHDFGVHTTLAMPHAWFLLASMGKHRVLRLPSCSPDDVFDYDLYLERLHHCLWRRWSMEQRYCVRDKLDPLDINWNKELDVTVLYGPDLTGSCPTPGASAGALAPLPYRDSAYMNGSGDLLSSSASSDKSSLFDATPVKSCLKNSEPARTRKNLHFKNSVKRRDIDLLGRSSEQDVCINDLDCKYLEFSKEFLDELYQTSDSDSDSDFI
ncbi:LAMI_0H09670g1_1 [Lachancea mirantina]|uniref:LAMI_0H09670g1_1 n=1 Tax=Lachancea mirantina TaxID=1230905 RepID=A0A1G4KGH2_9SACH|nr:LAMI_0H09670g1_1 [Lachancea mirantina]